MFKTLALANEPYHELPPPTATPGNPKLPQLPLILSHTIFQLPLLWQLTKLLLSPDMGGWVVGLIIRIKANLSSVKLG